MYRIREIKDYVYIAFVAAASFAAVLPLFHIIFVIVTNGIAVVAKLGFLLFTEVPSSPLSTELGGVAPAIVGSLIMTGASLPISILLSILAAILSYEFPGSLLAKGVSALVRSFASIPTIIVSMTIYSVVVVPMGKFSALAGAISLAIVTFPYAYTSFAAALSSVPSTYREAAFSLGMTRWTALIKIVLPIAWRGVATGVLISMARSMGETAAILFTAGRYRAGVNYSLSEPSDALPLLIFDFILTPFKRYHELAWGASFILFLSYLLIFVAVKIAIKEVRL